MVNTRCLKLILLNLSYLILILSSSVVQCKFIGSKGTLKMVHVIYRHGDRTPVILFSNTSSAEWPEGLGQLTNKGICEQYHFGQWLYYRYQELIDKRYNSNNNIYVRSTNMNRTIESAIANIDGIFETMNDEFCSHYLNIEQPLVHTVDLATDYLMGEPMPTCPAYHTAQVELMNSTKYKKILNDSQPLFQYLTKSIGYPVTDVIGALMVYDTLFVMQTHHKQLPEWSKSIFPGESQLIKLVRLIYASLGTPGIMAKLRSGFLLKEILDRCIKKSENTLIPDISMYQYSAHDTTIANMLNALGFYTDECTPPPYTSSILFELREFHNELYIELYYKNSISTPPPIYIPNCGYSCPLKKIYQLYDSVIPKNDFQTECNKRI